MLQYIEFTPEQKQTARQTDIADLLRSQGETLRRVGSEWQWRDGSDKVIIRGNLWFSPYEQTGGDAVSFVKKYCGINNYADAVSFLLSDGNMMCEQIYTTRPQKQFELPKRNGNMRRVYAYLLYSRGIDREVLNEFTHNNMIYESAKYHNAVFVGFDSNAVACHANLRSTSIHSDFKVTTPGSKNEYSFHWNGSDNELYLFESPIDMLSYITMNKSDWQQHSYAACCGVSDRVLFEMLKNNELLNTVYLCLDNDNAGRQATERIALKLENQGINYKILVPINKDWNEDLTVNTESEDEEVYQELQL